MADKDIFDMTQLLQSTCDDRELAEQVVGVFLSDIPKQIAALREAVDSGDAATAERVAHSIKGAAATVGGEALRRISFECELLGKQGDLDSMRAKIDEISAQYALLESELRANGFTEVE